MRRLERSKLSLTVWGLIGIGLCTVVALLAFFGIGWLTSDPYELKATFRSEAQLQRGSVVRIAGVEVGEVSSIEPFGEGSDAQVVAMALEDDALPIHTDASARIRARLVFEGNFYVEVDPGSPSAPEMDSGDTIGIDRTAGPVQLDRVLSALPASTRTDLRTLVQGLGRSLNEDGDGDGSTAGEAVNSALGDAPRALRGIANVTKGLRGEEPKDLSNLVRGSSGVLAAMAASDEQLAELISGFNATMQATGSRQQQLQRSVQLLPTVLKHSEETFVAVERALPNTVALTQELTPSIQELPATIEASYPWLRQVTPYFGRNELEAQMRLLKPIGRGLAKTVDSGIPLLRNLNSISQCVRTKLLPNGEVVINDPPQPSGPTVNQEFFQSLVGIVSATQNFDGNGRVLRAQTGGGNFPVNTSALPTQGVAWGNAALPPLGTRPAYNNTLPPINFGADCASGERPDLNSAATGGAP